MISVDHLFERCAVPRKGAVRWGQSVPLDSPGVYVVSTHQRGDLNQGLAECPLDIGALETLLRLRPEAAVDGEPADLTSLANRLRSMWVPGSPVVYVGLAGTSVQTRVEQFYSTPVGARAPHAGGWPVKMLRCDALWVHYGESALPDSSERTMLETFIAAVPRDTRMGLVDPSLPLPYANLQLAPGTRNRHGLSGVKATRIRPASSAPSERERSAAAPAVPPQFRAATDPERLTQNVTPADVARGIVRVPPSSKDIFPRERARISVNLADEIHDASWDPRTSGQKERSGVIRFGRGVLVPSLVGGPRRLKATDSGYQID